MFSTTLMSHTAPKSSLAQRVTRRPHSEAPLENLSFLFPCCISALIFTHSAAPAISLSRCIEPWFHSNSQLGSLHPLFLWHLPRSFYLPSRARTTGINWAPGESDTRLLPHIKVERPYLSFYLYSPALSLTITVCSLYPPLQKATQTQFRIWYHTWKSIQTLLYHVHHTECSSKELSLNPPVQVKFFYLSANVHSFFPPSNLCTHHPTLLNQDGLV